MLTLHKTADCLAGRCPDPDAHQPPPSHCRCIIGTCSNPADRTAAGVCTGHRCRAVALTTGKRCRTSGKYGGYCGLHRFAPGLPEGFAPDKAMLAWAREHAPRASVDTETSRFSLYWSARRLQRPQRIDWPAAWREWMLGAHSEQAASDLRAAQSRRSRGMLAQARHLQASPQPERPRGEGGRWQRQG